MDIKKAALLVGAGSTVIIALTCLWLVLNVSMCNYEANKAMDKIQADTERQQRENAIQSARIKAEMENTFRRVQPRFTIAPVSPLQTVSPPAQPVPEPVQAPSQKWVPGQDLPPGVKRHQ